MRKIHQQITALATTSLLGIAGIVWAHSPTRPVNPTTGVTGIYGSSHASFGYIGSSEAEAGISLDFLCRPQDVARYAAAACQVSGYVPTTENVTDMLRGLEQGMFKRDLQSNVAEYLLLQRRTLGDFERPMGVPRPSCVAQDSKAEWVRTEMSPEVNNILTNYETLVEEGKITAADLAPGHRRNLRAAQRLRAIEDTQTDAQIYQGLMYYDALKVDYSDRNCSYNSNKKKMACMGLAAHFEKLRANYPMLFDMPSETPAERTRLDAFRTRMYAVIGSEGASPTFNERRLGNRLTELADAGTVDTTAFGEEDTILTALRTGETKAQRLQREADEASRVTRGRQIYRTHVRDMSNGDTSALSNLNDKFVSGKNRSYESCTREEIDPDSAMKAAAFTTARKSCLTRKARSIPVTQAADQQVNERREQLRTGNAATIAGICDLSLEQMVERYPQVVRQMVADASGTELAAYRGVMCQSGLINKFAPNPLNTCTGVSGDPDGAKGMKVERSPYDFPFSSDTKYTIKRLPGGGLEVETTMNFTRGSGVKASEFKALMNSSVEDAKTFLNAQAGSQNPPLDPALTFKINAREGSSEPHVNIRKCWHSTRKTNKAACDGTPNQQDSGNWTLDTDTGTSRHEVGHVFGLADEYEAGYYAFNNLGEHDSVMNHSNADNRLYARHFASIVAPVMRCEAGSP